MANSPAKRMLQTITYGRKLQTRSPGRKRLRLDVSASTPREVVGEREEAALPDINKASPSSSCFDSEVTFDSGAFVTGAKHWRKMPHTELHHNTAEFAARSYPGEEFRRITRSYAKQKKLREAQEKGRSRGGELTFLADPSSEVGNTNTHSACVKIDNSTDNAFSGVTMSDASHVSGEFDNMDTKMVGGTRKGGYKGPEFSDSSCHKFASAENRVLKQLYNSPALEEGHTEQGIDLTCSEHLSNSEESPDISSCRELTLSQLGSDIITFGSGDSSFVYESSDEGFERSRDKSTPSFFPMFLRLGLEFSPSGLHGASSANGDEYEHEFTLMRFEDRDDEESYQRFRRRERKQALLYDYTEEYSTKTKYGTLIIEQRLVMVNWMVEHANAEDLEFETLFLGVGLMDRFLSRGFFKTAGNLELLGIACIILATRLEENQPYNCVRRKSFCVRGNTYSRHEVVAMEWFVQEVLNFQCFHLTTFNFLWFYLKAAKADETMEKLAKYLAVLSLLDHERLSFWPSTVAAGLVILASLATNHEISCNWVMETHVRTKNDDLSECIQSLDWLVKYAS